MAFEVLEKDNKVIVEGLGNFDLKATLECGQCFRWDEIGEYYYEGIVGDKAVRVVQKEGSLIFIGSSKQDFEDFWRGYFDLDTDYSIIIDILSKDDPVMKKAAKFAPGIRILKQPLFETLISFIISANNSIPNIKNIIKKLSAMYGEKTDSGHYTFPSPLALASADINDLMSSKAGYRSDYIKCTAKEFEENPVELDVLKQLGYEEAKKKLMQYKGVGGKVADCTLLFSGAFTNAFPVDVWVKKVMEELYLKESTPLKKISEYANVKFGNLGGYAQQYLFYYARSNL